MSAVPPAVPARWSDVGHVAGLAADSLYQSSLAAWLVPEEEHRRGVLTAVARIWVEQALLFGEAYLLADRSAAAVWFHRYRAIPAPADYAQRLTAACAQYRDRFRRLDRILHRHRPTEPHNHQALLAVAPGPWRTARASGLLARCLARMDRHGLPAYTELLPGADVPMYARHGYGVRGSVPLPDGTTALAAWRPPAGGGRGAGSLTARARAPLAAR